MIERLNANWNYENSIYATFQKVLLEFNLCKFQGVLRIFECEFYLCDYEFDLWDYILILIV